MLKAYITAAVVASLALAGSFVAYRYFSMSSELSETKAALIQQEAENARLVDISNRNAEAVARADADRRAAVEALEFLHAGSEINTKTSRIAESAIDGASAADDGDVAPVLESLRKTRFGGGS